MNFKEFFCNTVFNFKKLKPEAMAMLSVEEEENFDLTVEQIEAGLLPVKAAAKRKKEDPFSIVERFISDDPGRWGLHGVYIDPNGEEEGKEMLVATNGKFLAYVPVNSGSYLPAGNIYKNVEKEISRCILTGENLMEWIRQTVAGTILEKRYGTIPGRFPTWRQVVPERRFLATIDGNFLTEKVAYLKSYMNFCSSVKKIDSEYQYITVRMTEHAEYIFNCSRLEKVISALADFPEEAEIKIDFVDKKDTLAPVVFRKGELTIILMPIGYKRNEKDEKIWNDKVIFAPVLNNFSAVAGKMVKENFAGSTFEMRSEKIDPASILPEAPVPDEEIDPEEEYYSRLGRECIEEEERRNMQNNSRNVQETPVQVPETPEIRQEDPNPAEDMPCAGISPECAVNWQEKYLDKAREYSSISHGTYASITGIDNANIIDKIEEMFFSFIAAGNCPEAENWMEAWKRFAQTEEYNNFRNNSFNDLSKKIDRWIVAEKRLENSLRKKYRSGKYSLYIRQKNSHAYRFRNYCSSGNCSTEFCNIESAFAFLRFLKAREKFYTSCWLWKSYNETQYAIWDNIGKRYIKENILPVPIDNVPEKADSALTKKDSGNIVPENLEEKEDQEMARKKIDNITAYFPVLDPAPSCEPGKTHAEAIHKEELPASLPSSDPSSLPPTKRHTRKGEFMTVEEFNSILASLAGTYTHKLLAEIMGLDKRRIFFYRSGKNHVPKNVAMDMRNILACVKENRNTLPDGRILPCANIPCAFPETVQNFCRYIKIRNLAKILSVNIVLLYTAMTSKKISPCLLQKITALPAYTDYISPRPPPGKNPPSRIFPEIKLPPSKMKNKKFRKKIEELVKEKKHLEHVLANVIRSNELAMFEDRPEKMRPTGELMRKIKEAHNAIHAALGHKKRV